MGRPTSAPIVARTPGGVFFQWNLDSYRSRGARDAGAEALEVLVAWNDADAFLAEAVGYTTWDGSTPTLQRVLPLPHPLRAGFWCDGYDLSDYGAYESRNDFAVSQPLYGKVPVQDWCIYTLDFVRPKWHLLTDEDLAREAFNGREQSRYTWVTELPRPRERVVSGYGFEYDTSPAGTGAGPWQVVPDERQFVPDYQIDLVVTWVQVPIGAVPYATILDRMNTVNADAIRFVTGGRLWPVGELLFKGLANPLEQYTGADDELYYDLQYRFTVQPGGWNNYLTRDATTGAKKYKPVRVRRPPSAPYTPTTPLLPPYPNSSYQALFVPSAG